MSANIAKVTRIFLASKKHSLQMDYMEHFFHLDT